MSVKVVGTVAALQQQDRQKECVREMERAGERRKKGEREREEKKEKKEKQTVWGFVCVYSSGFIVAAFVFCFCLCAFLFCTTHKKKDKRCGISVG